MGRKKVWPVMNGIAERIPTLDDAEERGLDITDGTKLLWWLWICNLGLHSFEVIGEGVERAWVAKRFSGNVFVFTFQRVDDTTSRLRLTGGRFGELEVSVE